MTLLAKGDLLTLEVSARAKPLDAGIPSDAAEKKRMTLQGARLRRRVVRRGHQRFLALDRTAFYSKPETKISCWLSWVTKKPICNSRFTESPAAGEKRNIGDGILQWMESAIQVTRHSKSTPTTHSRICHERFRMQLHPLASLAKCLPPSSWFLKCYNVADSNCRVFFLNLHTTLQAASFKLPLSIDVDHNAFFSQLNPIGQRN